MEKLGQMDPVKPLVTVKLKNRPMDPFTASIIKAEYAKKKGTSQLSIIVRPTILEIYKTNF